MSCQPELVTGYVDGALEEAERLSLESHLARCPACREQLELERSLHRKLRELPAPEPEPGFEERVQARLRGTKRRPLGGVVLALAASLLLVLWARGAAPFVAWEVARDHATCFGGSRLPAEVWSDEPAVIASWFEKQGTSVPVLPGRAAGLELVGARYCRVGDRFAAHIYYTGSSDKRLSLFLVPGPLRLDNAYETTVRGRTVRFLRSAGTMVALVSEEADSVAAFAQTFSRSMAERSPPAVERGRSD